MADPVIGLLGLAIMFGLMVLRMPVGMAMLVVGFFGIWIMNGERAANAVLLTETYSATSNYALTVVPLFLLMSNVASVAGFSARLYEAAFAWVGWLRGGLASASILGCAAFSAVSGSSVATAATIGKVALPEMKRFGYADRLATGAIAAGGTLGFLIPPSTGFVIYAILTEESIGQLFMAGILPGLLLTGLFIATVGLMTWLRPDFGPRGAATSGAEKRAALARARPILVVIVVSIGGIYLGVFTPVEAAGVGATLVILMALVAGKLDRGGFAHSCSDTVRTTAMLFLIVIGANVLNPFLALTGLPATLGEAMTSLGLGPYGVLLLVILSYMIFGMFMDGLAMLVVTIPIFFPIIIGLGFDPIWFGVVAVIVIEMGMITPPVGLNVFVVKGVAKAVPMGEIFRGVLPFWCAMLICLVAIIAFPKIALSIPQTMFW
ncbi:C4-dicarboxylate ABC transporter permease [Phaeobacter inhibens]|uniref:TRAP transporter large permease n=1 Tax=Phaeobacter inhibens TaxID=221822 RepID=UPI00277989CF|nr:TRAP transporter large permease [Phaeobacter inhibens]GLO70897.1 C4-dicarboxylate ABC transporter permease [Phaeobacter inhibens]